MVCVQEGFKSLTLCCCKGKGKRSHSKAKDTPYRSSDLDELLGLSIDFIEDGEWVGGPKERWSQIGARGRGMGLRHGVVVQRESVGGEE